MVEIYPIDSMIFILASCMTAIIIQPMLRYLSDREREFLLDEAELFSVLKALAEPNRWRILNLLMEGMQCNCEIGEQLGLPSNLISHHLAILRQADLVRAERDVTDLRWIYYSVNQAMLEKLNATLQTFFDPNRIQVRQPRCHPHPKDESSIKKTASTR